LNRRRKARDGKTRLLSLTEPDEAALLSARLHPQMFTFADQIMITTGFTLRACLPLLGRDPPAATFANDRAGLTARIGWARAKISVLRPADFAGADVRIISHQAGQADLEQRGSDYLNLFALPNMWFHLSMAFAILRAQSIKVGKADFDGLHVYAPGFSWE
ncbi:MAG: DUF1993 family protein, partial [Rhodobacteraceae bacterium]|nr:DUF1993 family protein [Paracoccaceae bacterium]